MRSLIFFILLSFSFLAYSSDEGKSVVDLTVLNKLPKEKRDILKNEAEDFPSFWGMVKKSVNISGFDIYSTKKGEILVVRDGYILGFFSENISEIYPKDNYSTLSSAPFVQLDINKKFLMYSGGEEVFIDSGLDGIEVVRSRVSNPSTPFPGEILMDTFTSKIIRNGEDCIALPVVKNMTFGAAIGCCKPKSGGQVKIYMHSPSSWIEVDEAHKAWKLLFPMKDYCTAAFEKGNVKDWAIFDGSDLPK